ncbi:MAG: glycoside hydrolase family 95 protein [Pontiella sp.]
MVTMRNSVRIGILCSLVYSAGAVEDLVIWHDRPTMVTKNKQPPKSDWLRAFPIGNGSFGGMVYGNVARDEVQLNHDTFYALEPDTAGYIPNIQQSLPQVREWLAAGEYQKAEEFMRENWQGRSNAPYVTLGSLLIDLHENVEGMRKYRKSLDLSSATVVTEYELEGVRYRREYFASHPDQAIVVRLTADQPGKIYATVRLSTPHTSTTTFEAKGHTILMRGQGPGEAYRRKLEDKVQLDGHKYPAFFEKGKNGNYRIQDSILAKRKEVGTPQANILYADEIDGRGMYFASLLKAKAEGGSIRAEANALRVEGADSLTLVLCADTSFNGQNKSPSREGRDPIASVLALQEKVGSIDYAALREHHLADYQALFGRLGITLGKDGADKLALPTDRRLAEYGQHTDPSLAALFYQFSRYLAIAGSRAGSQPLNLQGIWNKDIIPPWNGAYTVNINAEMNYWNIERGNLSELHEPFLRSILECVENGKEVAREMYGFEGWCMHHNISIWRHCAPVDGAPSAAFWPMGAGWFLQHVWEHYEFTQDLEVLETHYEAMLEGARFLSQWLEDRGDGTLWTPVGISPENNFMTEGGTKQSVSPGPTMDIAIIRECFINLLAASELLGHDDPLLDTIRGQLPKLLPYQIGKHGQLQEWSSDFKEAQENHRHISHLYGFFPGNDELTRDPKLTAAVRKSLERRGNGATGWAMGWKLCVWARLGDSEQFLDLFKNLMTPNRVADNLFDLHPPFQIDGNFGAARGIAECLVQDFSGEVVLLPTLPSVWADGSVRGMVVKGNHEIDMKWSNGKLIEASIRSRSGLPVKVRYGNQTALLQPEIGQSVNLMKKLK